MEQVLEVWLENKPGALMRVAGVLTAKGLNIDRLVVEPDPQLWSVSRMVIVADVEPRFRVRVVKEMNRLINVLYVRDATAERQAAPLLPEPEGLVPIDPVRQVSCNEQGTCPANFAKD